MKQYNLKKDCLPKRFASHAENGFIICRRLPDSCPDQTKRICGLVLCVQSETITKKEPKEKIRGAL